MQASYADAAVKGSVISDAWRRQICHLNLPGITDTLVGAAGWSHHGVLVGPA